MYTTTTSLPWNFTVNSSIEKKGDHQREMIEVTWGADVISVKANSKIDSADLVTEALQATPTNGLVRVNQEKFSNEQEFLPAWYKITGLGRTMLKQYGFLSWTSAQWDIIGITLHEDSSLAPYFGKKVNLKPLYILWPNGKDILDIKSEVSKKAMMIDTKKWEKEWNQQSIAEQNISSQELSYNQLIQRLKQSWANLEILTKLQQIKTDKWWRGTMEVLSFALDMQEQKKVRGSNLLLKIENLLSEYSIKKMSLHVAYNVELLEWEDLPYERLSKIRRSYSQDYLNRQLPSNLKGKLIWDIKAISYAAKVYMDRTYHGNAVIKDGVIMFGTD